MNLLVLSITGAIAPTRHGTWALQDYHMPLSVADYLAVLSFFFRCCSR